MSCPWRRPCLQIKMESTQLCLAVLGLILAIGVHTGDSIMCYDCNSGGQYEGESCADPINQAANLVNCTEKYTDKTYTYCRKIGQDVEGEFRVVRSCGSAADPRFDKCIDRTGTREIKLKYCECEGDGCNSAQSVILSPILLCIGLLSLLALRT